MCFSSEFTVKVIRLAGNELQVVPAGEQGPAVRWRRRSAAIQLVRCLFELCDTCLGSCSMSSLWLGSVSVYVHYCKYIISGIFPQSSVGKGTTCGAPAPSSHPSETFLTTRSHHLVPHKHVTQDE